MIYAFEAVVALATIPCLCGFIQPMVSSRLNRCSPLTRSCTALPRREHRTAQTRLYVGGKIFGIEEPEEPVEGEEDEDVQQEESQAVNKENPDQDEEEDEEQEALVQEGVVMKPRKRRRKYSSADEDYLDREESKRRLAQEVGRKFPEIGKVVVDRYGKIIGGVDPFEGTDVNLEDQPDLGQEDFPEVGGVIAGMDDPSDAPWRLEAEKIIRDQVTKCGLTCYDILWRFHKLEVTVTRAAGDGPEEEAGYVDSDKLMEAIRNVNSALEAREEELFVLGRHELIVATPGSKDVLTTDREFKAFKGFDVLVKTGGPFKNKRVLEGKLLKRTFDELHITQSGRTVRIPLALVDEVRLPPAMVEAGDMFS